MANDKKTKQELQQEAKEKNRQSHQEQKETDENVTSQTPARPTGAEAQLDNMQEVDKNTIQKKAGTYKKDNDND